MGNAWIIKPCPHCGLAPTISKRDTWRGIGKMPPIGIGYNVYVVCSCGMRGPRGANDDIDYAIKSWNALTRISEPSDKTLRVEQEKRE